MTKIALTRSEDQHLPLLVMMSKCRFKTCGCIGKWGPVDSHCPGTHQYNTRSAHKFESSLSSSEKKESNCMDFQDSIGICLTSNCMEVGYPRMVCPRCQPEGVYQLLVKPNDDYFQYVDLYVSQHLRGCKIRNFTVNRKIIFEQDDAAVGGDDSSDEDSLAPDGNIVSPTGSVDGDRKRSAD